MTFSISSNVYARALLFSNIFPKSFASIMGFHRLVFANFPLSMTCSQPTIRNLHWYILPPLGQCSPQTLPWMRR